MGTYSLTWDQNSELARKPIPVDRYVPKSCRGLFEQVMTLCFENALPLIHSAEATVTSGLGQGHDLQSKSEVYLRNCQTALRDDWLSLWQAAMQAPAPPFRRLGANDAVIEDAGLSRNTAHSLYAAQKGHLGKARRQLRTPPPMSITSEVWMQAKDKLFPLQDDRPDLPM